jgi:hypothetical protein
MLSQGWVLTPEEISAYEQEIQKLTPSDQEKEQVLKQLNKPNLGLAQTDIDKVK